MTPTARKRLLLGSSTDSFDTTVVIMNSQSLLNIYASSPVLLLKLLQNKTSQTDEKHWHL